MGMPKMDIVGMLGSVFSPASNRTLGMAIHLMVGVVFAILYALLWYVGVGMVSLLWSAVFGVFMLYNGGMMAFMGGLMGHIIYGLVVALVYGLFV